MILLNYPGGESVVRRVIYKCVLCHELFIELYSYRVTLIDYTDLSCFVGNSQRSSILAKLFHCEPFLGPTRLLARNIYCTSHSHSSTTTTSSQCNPKWQGKKMLYTLMTLLWLLVHPSLVVASKMVKCLWKMPPSLTCWRMERQETWCWF